MLLTNVNQMKTLKQILCLLVMLWPWPKGAREDED